MAAKRCMNLVCGATVPGGSGEWRKGWRLRSGGFAALCDKCGIAYEQFAFCDIFHQTESGWRECSICGKRLHCGCIASKVSFDLLDSGGVQCNSCMKNSELSFMPSEILRNLLPQHHQSSFALSARSSKDGKIKDTDMRIAGSGCGQAFISTDGKIVDGAFSKTKIMQLGRSIDTSGRRRMLLDQRNSENGSFGKIKWEQVEHNIGDIGSAGFLNRSQSLVGSSRISQADDNKDLMTDNMICESLSQTSLSMSLGMANTSSNMEANSNGERLHCKSPPHSAVADGRDQNKELSALQQVQRARPFLPKPPKTGNGDVSKDVLSHVRVARPPAEGRGRNQLLPRYWPRITDQELQQISGDSNSTIVPLFEKVLSASDAGRIGRLVLPKACAEAYFPPISQPEGLPLTIQDAKGKEWHFQFRFWPNNNSRMYVLEGVTPCIQSLQLQAGDTVTFSRIDPEGKLVMGFRKATNNMPFQDSQISAIANGSLGNESFFPGVNENLSITDKHGSRSNEGLHFQSSQKKSRNIGAKSRRLLMDSEDALELKLTWEEAQDLLRPPPSAKPRIVMIEDHEFEEYEEPPIFGKKTIFTARDYGEQDQWIQCDDCYKWRRLPVDVLVPSKWTCADNTWDPKRSSCFMPDELGPKEVQNLLRQHADLKRRRTNGSSKQHSAEVESSGLDALAAAVALGEGGNQTVPPVGATTKHPRHRPGCTCIVCIQPPSGKGPKHNPSCTCNVCMTVKRRFKTLMMRKKKRLSEREEAESNKKIHWGSKEEIEGSCTSRSAPPPDPQRENESGPEHSRAIIEKLDMGKGQLDLNCDPVHEEDPQEGLSRPSMMSLLQEANLPLETYLKQNGLVSLGCEQGSSSSLTVPQAPGQSEGGTPEEGCLAAAAQERDSGVDEGNGELDKSRSDAA